jgi:hypothetical protein
MSSLQIAFSPIEFGFQWHVKECKQGNTGSKGYYTLLKNKSIYMTENIDTNKGMNFTIIKDGEIIYYGKIDTKYFAGQLFKNLGIN